MSVPVVVRDEVSKTRRDLVLNQEATRNALSALLVGRLSDELRDAARDGVQLVVLRSCTKVFSGGFDLSSMDAETDDTLFMRFTRIGLLLEQIANAPFIAVAAMEGAAVGAGADLALACDHRIGTARASFRFPGAAFGVVLGTQRLSALVGTGMAFELISSGNKLDSASAERLGILRIEESLVEINTAISELHDGLDRLPDGAVRGLKSAGHSTDGGKPLADLVRSIAAYPGFKNRVVEFTSSASVRAK